MAEAQAVETSSANGVIPHNRLEKPDADAAALRKIAEAERAVVEAEKVYTRAKNAAKKAKTEWEDSVAMLQTVIRAATEELPLFDRKPEASQPGEPLADESWREVPLVELGLAKGILGKLEEAGITTVGHLADYTSSGKPLTGIAGIGEGKAEQIASALDLFWEKRKSEQAQADAVEAPVINADGDEDKPRTGRRLWNVYDRRQDTTQPPIGWIVAEDLQGAHTECSLRFPPEVAGHLDPWDMEDGSDYELAAPGVLLSCNACRVFRSTAVTVCPNCGGQEFAVVEAQDFAPDELPEDKPKRGRKSRAVAK